MYVTSLNECQVLTYFWKMAGDPEVDRVALLQQLSDVALQRPPTWDYAKVRAINPWDIDGLDPPHACFCCRTGDRRLYWHHVIAVQHGGSVSPSNLVGLCYRCHRTIHPWLPERADADERYSSGWSSIGQIADLTISTKRRKESA